MSKFGTCRFCGCKKDLVESHIIPKFVTEHQKQTSATGFLRTSVTVNRRAQDGLKLYWLCNDCENRFNKWETPFATQIYHPLNRKEPNPFRYGPWLLKFAASVSWRSLTWYVEIAQQQKHYTEDFRRPINKALLTWKGFLLDSCPHPGPFEQHMIFFDSIESLSRPFRLPSNMNRFLTRGMHINLVLSKERPIYIYTKMGRVTLLGFIGIEHPRQWLGTQIHVNHGTIGGDMTLPTQFLDYLIERARVEETYYQELSERQQEIISKSFEKDFDKAASSESFQMMQRDLDMFGINAVFHKERDEKQTNS